MRRSGRKRKVQRRAEEQQEAETSDEASAPAAPSIDVVQRSAVLAGRPSVGDPYGGPLDPLDRPAPPLLSDVSEAEECVFSVEDLPARRSPPPKNKGRAANKSSKKKPSLGKPASAATAGGAGSSSSLAAPAEDIGTAAPAQSKKKGKFIF